MTSPHPPQRHCAAAEIAPHHSHEIHSIFNLVTRADDTRKGQSQLFFIAALSALLFPRLRQFAAMCRALHINRRQRNLRIGRQKFPAIFIKHNLCRLHFLPGSLERRMSSHQRPETCHAPLHYWLCHVAAFGITAHTQPSAQPPADHTKNCSTKQRTRYDQAITRRSFRRHVQVF